MLMCQHVSVVTNVSLSWEMMIVGEAMSEWRQVIRYNGTLYLVLNFAVNLEVF